MQRPRCTCAMLMATATAAMLSDQMFIAESWGSNADYVKQMSRGSFERVTEKSDMWHLACMLAHAEGFHAAHRRPSEQFTPQVHMHNSSQSKLSTFRSRAGRSSACVGVHPVRRFGHLQQWSIRMHVNNPARLISTRVAIHACVSDVHRLHGTPSAVCML